MRVKIGLSGILGLGLSVTVAFGQGPAQRAARLLPPRPADAEEVPVYARAAAEPLPQFPQSTPVKQQGRPNGQTWLNDPNVRPAAGTATNQPQPRPSQPAVPNNGVPREEGSFVSKGLEKIKSTFSNDRPEKPGVAPPAGVTQATAETPFRSTTPNGQPIYAGPPAYRWYGWGSVTPGANPYAPTGFSPKASAAWYSITGATPGAFPVTVTEGQRNPGTEPPAYVPSTQTRSGPPTGTIPVSANYVPPTPAPVRQSGPTSYGMPRPTSPVNDIPRVGMPQTEYRVPPPPTITPPPGFGAALPGAPVVHPVAVPTITPPPAVAVAAPAALPTTEPEQPGSPVVTAPYTLAPMLPHSGVPVPSTSPVAALPGQPAPLPTHTDGVPAPATLSHDVKSAAMPAPLPVSVTEQPNWQPNTSGGVAPQPDQNWKQPGATDTTRLREVARGQVADEAGNTVETLVRRMCEGRASAVELRWTGSNKLAVTFTCRSAADAQKLANDISARPELAAYRIDFSAQVK